MFSSKIYKMLGLAKPATISILSLKYLLVMQRPWGFSVKWICLKGIFDPVLIFHNERGWVESVDPTKTLPFRISKVFPYILKVLKQFTGLGTLLSHKKTIESQPPEINKLRSSSENFKPVTLLEWPLLNWQAFLNFYLIS